MPWKSVGYNHACMNCGPGPCKGPLAMMKNYEFSARETPGDEFSRIIPYGTKWCCEGCAVRHAKLLADELGLPFVNVKHWESASGGQPCPSAFTIDRRGGGGWESFTQVFSE